MQEGRVSCPRRRSFGAAVRMICRVRTSSPPPLPWLLQILIVGAQLGAVVVLLAWAIWLLLVSPPEYLECPFCTDYLMATLPVFRILLVPAVGLWTWALCVYVWEKKNINYKVGCAG